MTTTLLYKKLNRVILITLLFATCSFANGENLEIPPLVKSICLECHYISSLDIKGRSSGGDLSKTILKSKEFGSFDAYISHKYNASSDIFFLYPSKYVPEMAIVEGKLFTPDINKLLQFLEQIPPEPKFVFLWYHYVLGFIFLFVAYLILKRNRSKV